MEIGTGRQNEKNSETKCKFCKEGKMFYSRRFSKFFGLEVVACDKCTSWAVNNGGELDWFKGKEKKE